MLEGLEKYLIRMAKDRGASILPDHKPADISFTSTTGSNRLGGTGRQAARSDDKTWHVVAVSLPLVGGGDGDNTLRVEFIGTASFAPLHPVELALDSH